MKTEIVFVVVGILIGVLLVLLQDRQDFNETLEKAIHIKLPKKEFFFECDLLDVKGKQMSGDMKLKCREVKNPQINTKQ